MPEEFGKGEMPAMNNQNDESAMLSEKMISMLPRAALFARPSISKFCVGAIVRSESGKLYMGANMEFVGESLGTAVHAEQAAVMHAWHKGERRITHVAVNAPPCGFCRQFFMELRDAEFIEILLPGEIPRTLAELLPRPFGPADLGKTSRLLDEETILLSRKGLPAEDPLIQAALGAAEQSYAPYSGTFAGVALEFEGPEIIAGRYAENVAFSPSISPMASAFILTVLEGHEDRKILRAVLVEAAGTAASHRRDCEGILSSWSPDSELEYFLVPRKE